MMEPILLPVKTGAISDKDKRILRKSGVTVIECDEPDKLRLIKPGIEIDSFGMLLAAMRGIMASKPSYGEHTAASVMTRELTKMMEDTFSAKNK